MKSKDVLAKLLATENITIVHAGEKTASFNLKTRTLTLPLWENVSPETVNHLQGHEVGHALHTPQEDWYTNVDTKGSTFGGFLNVVEDARIEKLIQRKFPGLKRDFKKSYRELFDRNFFNVQRDQVDSMHFIDRINLHFKMGESFGVFFTDEEQVWVDRTGATETWEEVEVLTDELFAYCKAKNIEENKPDPEESAPEYTDLPEEAEEGYEEEDDEEESGTGSESDEDAEDEDESDNGSSSEESDETDGDDAGDESGDDEYEDDEDYFDEEDIASETDQSLTENLENMTPEFEGNRHIANMTLPTQSLPIISYKDLNEICAHKDFVDMREWGDALLTSFKTDTKAQVNYMVKEFEMKKRAAEYARTGTAKSGTIDCVKMNNYKVDEDIFRRVTVVPNGKNHGFVMYVDWSASMADYIGETVEQVMSLVMFCRKINVPHRVYAFSNNFYSYSDEDTGLMEKNRVVPDVGEFAYEEETVLLELFTDKMRKSEFKTMSANILAVATTHSRNGRFGSKRASKIDGGRWINTPSELMLGSTPLDETVVSARVIHNQFKQKYSLDIVNTFFLTDGASSGSEFLDENGQKTRTAQPRHSRTVFYDPLTRKTFVGEFLRYSGFTDRLMDVFRETTGSTTIGYRICAAGELRSVMYGHVDNWKEQDALRSTFLKTGFASIPTSTGYDALFALNSKKIGVEIDALNVDAGAKKSSIRSAFNKNQKGKKFSRPMLNELISLVA